MAVRKFHSRWKIYFQVLLAIFGLSLLAFGYLKVDMFLTTQKITDKRVTLQEQTQALDAYALIT